MVGFLSVFVFGNIEALGKYMSEKKKTLAKKCGIVMPISAMEDCTEQHWADVKEIIIESLEGTGFQVDLVSNSDLSDVIHKRIVENLYENPIIICDVSCRNANVMFELGLRLAFDKPAIIIKDDKTPFSFDTSIIEHIQYPRDLRYNKIEEFKKTLRAKVEATYKAGLDNPNYSTFLKHFVNLKAGEILNKEIPNVEQFLEVIEKRIDDSEQRILGALQRTKDNNYKIKPLPIENLPSFTFGGTPIYLNKVEVEKENIELPKFTFSSSDIKI